MRVRPESALAVGVRTRPITGERSRSREARVRVRLTPSDQDKLLLSVAGMLARDRLARGVLLNHPEAVALLSCW